MVSARTLHEGRPLAFLVLALEVGDYRLLLADPLSGGLGQVGRRKTGHAHDVPAKGRFRPVILAIVLDVPPSLLRLLAAEDHFRGGGEHGGRLLMAETVPHQHLVQQPRKTAGLLLAHVSDHLLGRSPLAQLCRSVPTICLKMPSAFFDISAHVVP